MRYLRRVTRVLLLTAMLGGCAPIGAGLPQSTPADADRPMVFVNLSYARPAAFQSGGRPYAFYLIADYRSSTEVEEYSGTWNDQTQTLSATVNVPLRAENLVYVVDSAMPPGMPTPISAQRIGALHETGCAEGVPAVHPCYLLQVLR